MKTIYKVLLAFIAITVIATFALIKSSGDSDYIPPKQDELTVNDVTKLNPIKVAKVIKPTSDEEISAAIKNSSGPISIGGGRYSMGGQTAYEDSLHIDMRSFNKVIGFDKDNKTITVQTGITWRDIQEYIDPYDLSVRIMQTYSNFTVGGSLSVNVHGRYIGEGPLIRSVRSIKMILVNGEEKEASRDINPELFYSAIGGYGGIGVITEATLSLADNSKIERRTTLLKTKDYLEHFNKDIRDNSNVVFHNGDLYPPDYEEVRDVSWYKTDKPITIKDRLIKRNDDYWLSPFVAEFVADYDIGKYIRKNLLEPIYYSFDRVVWRNWEASYDVAELEPESRDEQTYVLREYFVPVRNFYSFIPDMKEIFNKNKVNVLNVSIRHAHAAPENYLSWAREEVFAFVVYYRQGTDDQSKKEVKKWSNEITDAVIKAEGTYYLPYQIFASQEQFLKSYPNSPKFFEIKKKYDPENRFRNELWKHYYPEKEHSIDIQKENMDKYFRDESNGILSIPEWYLVFNPLEYAEFLKSGKNPSDFHFFASIDEYWKLYDRVISITKSKGQSNAEYETMLKVIGISTTVEYMLKGVYENTIGRFTYWLAGEETQEDKIIKKAQRAYSNLIFDEAWYKFDFWSWVKRIWSETDFFGENFIRKTERKIFFTLEFGFKTLYAKLIGYAAQNTYEPSDGLVYLTVTIPKESVGKLPKKVKILYSKNEDYIISVPRWGDFTKIMPVLSSVGIKIKDISGNKEIIISTITSKESNSDNYESGRILFNSEIVSNPKLVRKVVSVPVKMLDEFFEELSIKKHRMEHLYDF